jgi:hypothetical protein
MVQVTAALLMAAAGAQVASAGEHDVLVSHRTGLAQVGGRPYPEGEPVRVPAGGLARLVVVDTSTALFEFEVTAEEEGSDEAKQVQQAFAAAKYYVADVPAVALPPTPEAKGLWAPAFQGPPFGGATPIDAAATEKPLRDAMTALAELRGIRLKAAGELQKMSRCPASTLSLAEGFAKEPGNAREAGEKLEKAMRDLAVEQPKLEAQLGFDSPESEKRARAVATQAGKLLADVDAIVAEARQTELLVARVAGASVRWTSPQLLPVRWDRQVKLTVKISPRKEVLAGLPGQLAQEQKHATLKSRVVKVVLAPEWPLRMAVGLSYLVAPGAAYPALEVADDGSVRTKGKTDARFLWAVTVAGSIAELDDRPRSGWAGWFELSFSPSDVRAFAVGAALSWRVLKLGAGAIWARHQRAEGDGIAPTYGNPACYVSLGLIGVPFLTQ